MDSNATPSPILTSPSDTTGAVGSASFAAAGRINTMVTGATSGLASPPAMPAPATTGALGGRRTLSGVQRLTSGRRRQAAVDFESDFDDADDGVNLTTTTGGGDLQYRGGKGADGPPEWRDHYRQCFMNLPCRVFHLFVLVATLVLVAVAFLDPQSTQAVWYHFLEGTILVIFVTEVASRLYIARSHFWASKINAVEAGICGLCVVAFLAMTVAHHGGSREEHEVVMGLRYVAQLLRLSVFYKSGLSAVTTGSSSPVTGVVIATNPGKSSMTGGTDAPGSPV
jgi:hypothetical protein